MNLQPDMHETDKDANFLDQKGEKFNLFYEEYVIGASLLDFIKVDSSCVHENDSGISMKLNNNGRTI
ncbi:18488_t:CDS:2 [Gigaspora margarita]|uniref:18488_t:CDS:1 n=1 Tax=Gigaspora margarita TaxID=4874 RepID=A0ABN7VBE4_GIGMA|nr:18488_t:CDS:2 [Gigaspora margarita]